MAITLHLSDEDDRLLTERAEKAGRSRHAIAVEAVHAFLTERQSRLDRLLGEALEDDRTLLDRLAD